MGKDEFTEREGDYMNYMSGMMMGLAFGQGVRRFLTGGASKRRETPAFTLARAIPGRRRYYAKGLLGNEALATALEEALSKIDYIDEVKANHVSGSLLLVYHGEEAQIDAIAERLENRVFSVPAQDTEMGASDVSTCHEGTAEGLASFGQSIRGTFNALNHQMKFLTKGWLDLPSLLSFVFTIRGLQKILLAKQLPSGPQLIWWAFSLLRGWRIA